jgi:hypothetical protein
MMALPRSDHRLYASSAMALALLACGVDAQPSVMGETKPAAILAKRAYASAPIGDARENDPSARSGAEAGDAASDGANGGALPEHAVAMPTPVHRYRFEGQGTIVRDSIGGADGTVVDAELAGDGLLRLPGSGGYVELPGGLLSQHRSATLEFWLAWEGDPSSRRERIFDFNSNPQQDAGSGVDTNFFLSPNYEDDKPRLRFRDQSGDESQLFSWRVFPARRIAHVVVVLDGVGHSMAFYMDGESLGSSPWNQSLAGLGDENVWLGRSQQAGDPDLSATFDEFRIYDQALSSEQIEENFRNGPDSVTPPDVTRP